MKWTIILIAALTLGKLQAYDRPEFDPDTHSEYLMSLSENTLDFIKKNPIDPNWRKPAGEHQNWNGQFDKLMDDDNDHDYLEKMKNL